jgi:hypothetical protein
MLDKRKHEINEYRRKAQFVVIQTLRAFRRPILDA